MPFKAYESISVKKGYDTMHPYGDNFIPVIPVETILHSPQDPFCPFPTCPCHEDEELIGQVQQYVSDGLLTESEATNFVAGKMWGEA